MKKENKLYLSGTIIDKSSIRFSRIALDFHYRSWLGDMRIRKVDIQELPDNCLQIDLYRKYGESYVSKAERTSFKDTGHMYSLDYHILLGDIACEGNADLLNVEGPFIHYYSVDDFFEEYKKIAKGRNCIIPEKIEVDDDYEKVSIKFFLT